MTIHKEAMVAEVWDFSRAERGWALVFVRDFNDWEMEEVERLLQLLHRRKIMSYQEDQLLLKVLRLPFFQLDSCIESWYILPHHFSFLLHLESYCSP